MRLAGPPPPPRDARRERVPPGDGTPGNLPGFLDAGLLCIYGAEMQRFSVAFEDGDADALRLSAAKQRCSVAELIRVRVLGEGEPRVEEWLAPRRAVQAADPGGPVRPSSPSPSVSDGLEGEALEVGVSDPPMSAVPAPGRASPSSPPDENIFAKFPAAEPKKFRPDPKPPKKR